MLIWSAAVDPLEEDQYSSSPMSALPAEGGGQIAARNLTLPGASGRISQCVGVAPVELRPCFIVDAGGASPHGFRRQFGAVKV